MTIDWTKPLETDETPPRPVTDRGEIKSPYGDRLVTILSADENENVFYVRDDCGIAYGDLLRIRNVVRKRKVWVEVRLWLGSSPGVVTSIEIEASHDGV